MRGSCVVELPNGFSTLSMKLTTDWVSGKRDLFDFSNDTIPLVCIRYGGPPLAELAGFVKNSLLGILQWCWSHTHSTKNDGKRLEQKQRNSSKNFTLKLFKRTGIGTGIYTSSLVFLCSSFSAREIYEQISSNIANTSSLNDTGEIELADQ
ncbi:hypothetical protein SUGI_0877310 [Cryptomeria japonica]|nr:hypothetical protein SUGI_0877310 [Cryptomeria japonica]